MKLIKAFLFFTSVFLSLMFLSFFLLTLLTKEKLQKDIISPLVAAPSQKPEEKVLSLFSTGLENAVKEALTGTKGTYSVVIKNLRTNETYSQNPDREYVSASLYKLWMMAVVYDQIEKKELTLDQKLTESVATINKKFDLATDSAELTEGNISLSVTDALTKMITVSDNYSALLFSSKLGVSKMTALLKEYALTDSKTGSPPKTTAADIARFYELLYTKKLISPTSSTAMIELLKRQALNDRIPKYLPEDTEIAHKTGELDGVKHDAGIIFTDTDDYILVVLSESTNPSSAAERIALVSKNVYEYFTSTRASEE